MDWNVKSSALTVNPKHLSFNLTVECGLKHFTVHPPLSYAGLSFNLNVECGLKPKKKPAQRTTSALSFNLLVECGLKLIVMSLNQHWFCLSFNLSVECGLKRQIIHSQYQFWKSFIQLISWMWIETSHLFFPWRPYHLSSCLTTGCGLKHEISDVIFGI